MKKKDVGQKLDLMEFCQKYNLHLPETAKLLELPQITEGMQVKLSKLSDFSKVAQSFKSSKSGYEKLLIARKALELCVSADDYTKCSNEFFDIGDTDKYEAELAELKKSFGTSALLFGKKTYGSLTYAQISCLLIKRPKA